MSKGQNISGYQKGVIKRYYENKDDISMQRISEIVSNLYLETKQLARIQLWKQAETALNNMTLKDEQRLKVTQVIKSKDVIKLAALISEIF